MVRWSAERYRRDLSADQPTVVECWVEAAGMVPQIARVAEDYGVAVLSSGGFDSSTAKHDAVRRFVNRYDQEGRRTMVLHVGDYDPSGCALIDSLAEDVAAFCADYGKPGIVEFRRVVLVAAQVDRYQLPTAPHTSAAPESDSRSIQLGSWGLTERAN